MACWRNCTGRPMSFGQPSRRTIMPRKPKKETIEELPANAATAVATVESTPEPQDPPAEPTAESKEPEAAAPPVPADAPPPPGPVVKVDLAELQRMTPQRLQKMAREL